MTQFADCGSIAHTMKRRNYLATAGAVATSALIAGCSGNGGNGGNGNGNGNGNGGGNGNGNGNGGGTTETTSQGELEELTLVMAPGKFPDIAMHQINTATNILADEMESAGYTVSVEKTFSGGTLFASGQAQISAIGPIEATDMATARDFDLVHHAKVAPNYQGWYVNSDSPYTTEATGSVQASVDQIVSDGATVAHGSWGGGHVLADKFVHGYVFDHTFAEEGGDFEVVTLDYSAIPQAIAENRVPVGVSFGTRAAPQLLDGSIVNLYHYQDILSENDLGENTLNCWSTKEGFTDEYPGAMEAFVNAWQQGVDRVFEDPVGIATSEDVYQEMLEVNNQEQAEWAAEWAMTEQHGYTHGQLYEDASITDEWIDRNETFLNNGVEIGIVAEDWSDHLTFSQELS
jgi:ABC-type nitrate/sulfonate/bicarbonate transport system substrate-binding protein